jgi:hypothetical protein
VCIFFGTASIFYSFLQSPGRQFYPPIEHFSIFLPLSIVSVAPAAEAGTARMIHQADMQKKISRTGCQKCAFHRQLSTFCNILDYFNK